MTSDFLSRCPLVRSENDSEPYELIFTVKSFYGYPITFKDVRSETLKDRKLSLLKKYVINGFPRNLKGSLREYGKVVDELSILHDCLLFKDRLVIPEKIRNEYLIYLLAIQKKKPYHRDKKIRPEYS